MKIKFDKILGMLREEDESTVIGGDGTISGHVVAYVDLPDALTHTGEYYIVDINTGTWILGTLKSAGIYKSNGTTWVYIDSVPETTSLSDGTTVITGTNIILEGGKNISTTTNAVSNKITFATDDLMAVDAIQFNTLATEDCSVGQMSWDTTNGTLKVGMLGSDVCLNLGQEEFIYAKNTSGAIITNGTPVYISGASGANIEIAKADASSQDNCRKTIAVATEDIAINAFGYVTTFGYVRDINTNGFTEGGEVFIAVGGGYTQTRPALPNCIVKIGTCARANNSNGVIFVNIETKSTKDILTDSGDLTIRTQAQKTLVLEQTVYDDFLPSITNPALGVSAPDLINLTVQGVIISGYGFDGLNTEERLSIKTEMYHSYKEGTTICVHVHFMPTTNDAGTVTWYFDYFYAPANSAPIAGTTISSTTNIPANSLGRHFLVDIGDITIAELGIGDFIVGNLRRTPTTDTYPADALLMQVANHVQIDTIGSRQEYIK